MTYRTDQPVSSLKAIRDAELKGILTEQQYKIYLDKKRGKKEKRTRARANNSRDFFSTAVSYWRGIFDNKNPV